ncbi:hypothetical protein [Desulfosporosinus sp.]|uniref:hypothetical protein n=1 Tax=Desulfosporosinus sp. TaxID=157907 RepID=UPI0025C5BF80|nr:hypothetical protein [Desulfosporosinus sp.]MBC2722553.1 hypothetical protein [Desulfosporosinus sp.]MBC2726624.1 hypothetical protein [Desulfosporosinus sp.]
MAEKNIIAYFKSPEEANKVADQMKSLGVEDIQIDRFGKYPLGSADQLSSPGTGELSSQATLTLGASEGRDTGILASADVSASGMSDGGENPISGRDIVLAAIVDQSVFDKAKQFIKDADGLV